MNFSTAGVKEYLKEIDKVIENGKYKNNWGSLSNHKMPAWYYQGKFEYKGFLLMFKAEKFVAEKLAELFKKSGENLLCLFASIMTALPVC